MKNSFTVKPIAYIHTDFKEKFGIPRQSGRAPSLTAKIIFTPEYRNADALREIEGFSHLWLLFDFSLAHKEEWSPTVRPPRLGGNKRVGVFASRSPFRPNPIGLSCVKLIKVEQTDADGAVLIVSGADLLDGTPILDIKPYLPFADCIADATAGYAGQHEKDGVEVHFPQALLEKIPEEKRKGLIDCLKDDPRPSYQDEGRSYGMRFADFEIKFTVEKGVLTVTDIDNR
ncbi:MAG: tRNA (N6-threonylcarbamoyladenosine(37)-N6)-methyltransferase TrmO [Clostridia bacterium]|nr:tRNA (N6-threonylcarbamoyladenosine(37)-N6)-methyltransferase TrmO [Clostridia bacterium]